MPAFMQHCEQRIGKATLRTPRTTITAFIGLLAVLEQNPGAAWQTLLHQTQVDIAKASEVIDSGNELSDLNPPCGNAPLLNSMEIL
jgi:hypothetical protein